MAQYIQVTESFYNDYNFYTVSPNVLYIVKDLDKRYVTSINSYDEFTEVFQKSFGFVLVDEEFYNQNNGSILLPEMTKLNIRKTNDNKYVVEQNLRHVFSHLFTMNEPIVRYTMMDFQDTYLTLDYDDFDHSNDISVG